VAMENSECKDYHATNIYVDQNNHITKKN